MAETTKVPVKGEEKAARRPSTLQAWPAFGGLQREVNRLFEDFDRNFWGAPFRRSLFEMEPFLGREPALAAVPAVDIAEKDNAYEVKAELPGMAEKDIDVKVSDGNLTIKGEKQEEKEEKNKDYYLQERRFGSFERRFRVPEGVDLDKIEANFKNGVLTVTLPKKPEAQAASKKIEVKGG